MPTFKEHQTALFTGLGPLGWKLSAPDLKVRHATKEILIDGRFESVRLWFKPQSVYYSVGNAHNLNGARTLSYNNSKQWANATTLDVSATAIVTREQELANDRWARRGVSF